MKRRTMAFGGLLMAVAMTGYSVAGTYAKYISTVDMTDQARVAKWDFRNEASTTVDLFQASYVNDNGVYVASSDLSKVVAPGTHGTYTYTIKGSAETNFKVTQNKTIKNKIFLLDFNGQVVYNPIEFSFNGIDWERATKPVLDENGKIVALTFEETEAAAKVYPANYELSNTDVTGTISWRWAFDNEENEYSNDALDTTLGNKVAEDLKTTGATNLTITATIGATVVQTQEVPNNMDNAKYVTMTNYLTDEDVEYWSGKAGYDYSKANEVRFNGNTLTGTIYKTTGANAEMAKAYFGADNGGYYYVLNIRNVTNTPFYVMHSKENKIVEVPADDSFSLMISLNTTGTQSYPYTVYADRATAEADKAAGTRENGTKYSVDYSTLNFR